jgi:hypothetical protein
MFQIVLTDIANARHQELVNEAEHERVLRQVRAADSNTRHHLRRARQLRFWVSTLLLL